MKRLFVINSLFIFDGENTVGAFEKKNLLLFTVDFFSVNPVCHTTDIFSVNHGNRKQQKEFALNER